MNRIVFTLLAMLFSLTLVAQKTNFSGKWKINLVKSEYGNTPAESLAAKLNIVQSPKEMSIERLWVVNEKESGYTERFTSDTAVFERKINSNMKMVSTIKWSDDRKILTEIMKVMNGNEVLQTITQVNTLMNDGKSLKLDQTVNAGGDDNKMTIIYEK
jgi:hypothetical protein